MIIYYWMCVPFKG